MDFKKGKSQFEERLDNFYWIVIMIHVAALWPLLIFSKFEPWSLNSEVTVAILWGVTLFMILEDWWITKTSYSKYEPSNPTLIVVYILYLITLVTLAPLVFVAGKAVDRSTALLSLGFLAVMLCVVSILDIAWCVLYMRQVKKDDIKTRLSFVVFIIGRDIPAFLLYAFLAFMIFTSLLDHPIRIAVTMSIFFGIELILGYTNLRFAKKNLTLLVEEEV